MTLMSQVKESVARLNSTIEQIKPLQEFTVSKIKGDVCEMCSTTLYPANTGRQFADGAAWCARCSREEDEGYANYGESDD